MLRRIDCGDAKFRLQTSHQCPYRYCAACRTLDTKAVVTSSLFQDVVAQALRQLFGYVGGAVQIDLLHLADSVGIIKVDHRYTTAIAVFESIHRNSAARPSCRRPPLLSCRDWQKLWSACTLHTQYQSVRSRLEVSSNTVQEKGNKQQMNSCPAAAGQSIQPISAVSGC